MPPLESPGTLGAMALGGDQSYFRQIFELSPDPTWIIEGNRFVECNEAAIRTLGYPGRDQLLNVHPSKLSPPRQTDGEDSYVKAERMMALAQVNGLHRFEWIHTKANGTDFVAEVTLSAIQLPGRKVIYCVWRDSTERKQTEETLLEATQQWQTTFNAAQDAICLLDKNQKIMRSNPAMAALTGVSAEHMSGKHCWEVVHGTTEPIPQCPLMRARTSLSREQMELRSGNRWLNITVDPVLGDAQEFQGAVHIIRDITERKQIEAERERLLSIIDDATDFISTSDMEGRILFLNAAGARMTCHPVGVDVATLGIKNFHPQWAARRIAEEAIPAALKNGSWQGECALLHRDGHEIPVSQMVLVHRDDSGTPLYLSTIIRDITERKQAEEKLIAIMKAVESSSDAIGISDAHGHHFFQNKALSDLFGYASAEELQAAGGGAAVVKDPQIAREMFSNIMGGKSWVGELEMMTRSGRVFCAYERADAIKDSEGKIIGLIGIITDITERKQLEERVRQMAFHDTLTQLPNRRLLDDRLSQSMVASNRSGIFGALMFLDLDDFKLLNDTHGHAVGDLLLTQAAERLTSCVREGDTVARFGGDEFVVMISDLSVDKSEATAQARHIAEKIGTALGEPYALKLQRDGQAATTVEHSCTASIGVTLFGKNETSQEDILKQADMAMYQAKEAGSNLIRFYEVGG